MKILKYRLEKKKQLKSNVVIEQNEGKIVYQTNKSKYNTIYSFMPPK